MHRAICVAIFALLMGQEACAADAPPAVAPDSTYAIGAGIASVPEYAGARDSRTTALLTFDYANKNGLFASTRRGVGYQSSVGPFQFSAALGYDPGRREKGGRFRTGSDALRGMGNVAGGALGRLALGYDFGFMSVGVEANLALSRRERGNTFQLAVGVPLVANARDQVSLFGVADYSDVKNMQTYYGVTQLQSARSGFVSYTPSAGFDKVGVGLSANHQISKNWSVQTMAGAFTLVGDAKKSPRTRRVTTPILVATFRYAF